MKQYLILIILTFFLWLSQIYAVDFSGSPHTVSYIEPAQGLGYYSAEGYFSIGQSYFTDPSRSISCRTKYTFDLSYIPTDAEIVSVSLSYVISDNLFTLDFNIKQIDNYNTPSEIYNGIGSGTTLFSNITYGSGSLTSSTLTSLVNNYKGGNLYLGANSRYDHTDDSNANLSLTLNISFKIKIIADNNFIAAGGLSHGNMLIDGATCTIPLNGYNYLKTVGQNVSLSAISPQTSNQGYQMIWNTATCGTSKWTRNNEFRSNNQTYSFNLVADDNNKVYKANFFPDHVTTSGVLAGDETWISSVNLSGNVNVPSGKSLTIFSCGSINLNGHSIISTGGTIDLQGSINGLRAKLTNSNVLKGLFPTIQSAVDNSSAGNVVELIPGTFNDNVSVSNKNNLFIYGTNSTNLTGTFTFSGCSNLNLTMSTYNNINLYNCTSPSLYCSIAGSSSVPGFGFYYCSNFNQTGASITGCNIGVNAVSSSGYSQSSNFSSTYCNISATSGANVYAYNNRFCTSVPYDFSATSSGIISVCNCYRCGNPYYQSGGTVNLNACTNYSCSQPKINTGSEENNEIQTVQSSGNAAGKDEFSEVNESYFNLLKKFNESKEKGVSNKDELQSQYLNIAKDFKSFIKKNPQSPFVYAALNTAVNSFQLFEDKAGMKSFLDEVIGDKELSSLKSSCENLMIDYYREIKDFNSAVRAADALINKYKNNEDLYCDGLLKKGLILSYELNQPEKAAECFSAILKNYPDNKLSGFAKNSLEVIGGSLKDSPSGEKISENTGFGTSAYPNPFNPSTIIKYSLPENCKVVLDVYTIIGEKAASLVNDTKAAGTYDAVFNGSNLASGVYIYKITAVSLETGKQFVKSAKIMLVK